jgi:hypothetical protein
MALRKILTADGADHEEQVAGVGIPHCVSGFQKGVLNSLFIETSEESR